MWPCAIVTLSTVFVSTHTAGGDSVQYELKSAELGRLKSLFKKFIYLFLQPLEHFLKLWKTSCGFGNRSVFWFLERIIIIAENKPVITSNSSGSRFGLVLHVRWCAWPSVTVVWTWVIGVSQIFTFPLHPFQLILRCCWWWWWWWQDVTWCFPLPPPPKTPPRNSITRVALLLDQRCVYDCT